ncbi:hypothetical protein HDU79_011569 [Rhizoclosmatium sp. JEL0117]|nr:hypothetical protein HDU79_011569 [Rhizoclosmatium sp. JEL0117]
MSQVPTIVVIGGSFAGINAIKKIDTTLKTKANVILVEEREAFFLTVAALRSVTEPGFAAHTWIPYTSLFQNNPASKIIKARATEVHPTQVKLNNGETLPFDYLIIATGTTMPAPGQTQKTEKADGIAESESILAALKSANSVTIVGGGIVGVELAGEIATDFPTKKVTIIHSGATLMNRNGLKPKAMNVVNQQLAKLNVTVLLNERVVPEYDGSILPNHGSFNLTPSTIKTSSGKTIESDVQFVCTGAGKPNSSLAKSLGGVLNEEGFIKVGLTGQVQGFTNIFAIGDVSTLDPLKLAYLANGQGTLIGENVVSLVNKPTAALKVYKPMEPGSFVILSIGRNGGVLQSPIGVFGPRVPKAIKSKDLFVASKWKELNLTPTYKPPTSQ